MRGYKFVVAYNSLENLFLSMLQFILNIHFPSDVMKNNSHLSRQSAVYIMKNYKTSF